MLLHKIEYKMLFIFNTNVFDYDVLNLFSHWLTLNFEFDYVRKQTTVCQQFLFFSEIDKNQKKHRQKASLLLTPDIVISNKIWPALPVNEPENINVIEIKTVHRLKRMLEMNF